MASDPGQPDYPDRDSVISLIEQAKAQRGINDQQFCAILNRTLARTANRSFSGPSRISLDRATLQTMREGGSITPQRLLLIAEAIRKEFGFTAPAASAASGMLGSVRKFSRRMPLGRALGIAACLTIVVAYVMVDDGFRERFEGLATLLGALPILFTCFLVIDYVRNRSPS